MTCYLEHYHNNTYNMAQCHVILNITIIILTTWPNVMSSDASKSKTSQMKMGIFWMDCSIVQMNENTVHGVTKQFPSLQHCHLLVATYKVHAKEAWVEREGERGEEEGWGVGFCEALCSTCCPHPIHVVDISK